MDRRELLKSMSLALGYTLTPAALSGILSSCAKEAKLSWIPKFFTKEEALGVELMAEAILPKTDIPGAVDVGAHIFADTLLSGASSDEEQTKIKKAAGIWLKTFEGKMGKSIAEASVEDVSAVLSEYLGIEWEAQEGIKEMMGKETPEANEEEDYYTYTFIFKIKELTMWGYYASEEIGENVLSYLPIPGPFQGCIPTEEVGYAWSL